LGGSNWRRRVTSLVATRKEKRVEGKKQGTSIYRQGKRKTAKEKGKDRRKGGKEKGGDQLLKRGEKGGSSPSGGRNDELFNGERKGTYKGRKLKEGCAVQRRGDQKESLSKGEVSP